MATEEPRFYDAHDVMASERTAEPEPADATIDTRELEAKYLLGMAFPAAKTDAVEAARANGAPPRALELLERLGDREYKDVGDLIGELDRVAAGDERAEPAADPTAAARAAETTRESPAPAVFETAARTAAGAPRRARAIGIAVLGLVGLVLVRRRRR